MIVHLELVYTHTHVHMLGLIMRLTRCFPSLRSNLFHNNTYFPGAVDALFSINAAGRINNDVIEAFNLSDTYPSNHPSYRTSTRRIEQSTSFRRITVK